jgi:hypothetical protein
MNTGSNPYGASMPVKLTPETVTGQMAKASGKAKARFPHPPLKPDQMNASAGKGGKRQAL